MKKRSLYLMMLIIMNVFALKAQDLAKKIPENALAVGTIKGKNFLELVSISEINKSTFGKKILEKVSEKSKNPIKSIEDFGVDITGNMYYFFKANDSLTTNFILIPVKDITKIDALFSDDSLKFSNQNGIRTYTTADSSAIINWNKEMLVFTYGKLNETYFSDSTKAARYNIKSYYNLSYNLFNTKQEYLAETDSLINDATDSVKYDPTGAVEISKGDGIVVEVKPQEIHEEDVEQTKSVLPPLSNDSTMKTYEDNIYNSDSTQTGYNKNYEDSYEQDRQIGRELTFRWSSAEAQNLFIETNSTSILNNESFQKNQDPQAEATFWLPSLAQIYSKFIPSSTLYSSNLFNGYKNFNAKLFLENKEIKIQSSLELEPAEADVYNRIYEKKINKKFLKYINSDKLTGFFGYSIDTKTYLEEIPTILKTVYSNGYFGNFADEVDMGADLFSLLLDEAAVAKMVKGDLLFVLNNLTEMETTYTDYEYDENYNSKEVEKTKKELQPDFLMMFSTDDSRLFEKLFKYGIKKNFVTEEDEIYTIEIKKSIFKMYVLIKDGIFFLSSSKPQMTQIKANNYQAKVSQLHKNLLLKSNFSAFMKTKKLSGKIPDNDLGLTQNMESMSKKLALLGDVYLKSNKIKNNMISGEIVMNVPGNFKNAMAYLFNLANDFNF